MTIIDYLAEEKKATLPLVERFLNGQIQQYSTFGSPYATLLVNLREHLLRGGKWVRPALALLGYRLAGGEAVHVVRENVAALELIHRYLLIHDDILDQDLTRHGGPTMEQIYKDAFATQFPKQTDQMFSKGMAIVAGDVVNAMAYALLGQNAVDSRTIQAAMQGLSQLLMETCAGWQLQTEQNFLPIHAVSDADCVQGMTLVSAQYSVVWPLRIGQIFAGRFVPSTWDVHLDTYGLEAGLAFQITDDILGMFGSEEKTGKPVGHDYREGKKTLLILQAYSKASTEQRDFFQKTLGTQVSDTEVKQAQDIIIATGALKSVQTLAEKHADAAICALKEISTHDSEAITLLSELAQLFVRRDH